MDGWLQFPKRRPRRSTREGVRAASRRGEIGGSWWSKRFLSVLESMTIANRLSRGRSYARSGQVIGLSVSGAWVTAHVQGSARRPYEVWIQVPRLSDAQWDRVEEALAGQARLLAAMLAGEMPADIEDAFAAAGLSLFPSSPGELAMDCSCPDLANPCKHVAATIYLLAEAFDRDPFLIFEWRGRGRDAFLDGLRKQRARIATAGEVANAEPGSNRQALPLSPVAFWGEASGVDRLHFDPRASEDPAAVLLALDPAPVHPDGSDVTVFLVAAYEELTAAAERRAREVGVPYGSNSELVDPLIR